jgi:hypothetical protein
MICFIILIALLLIGRSVGLRLSRGITAFQLRLKLGDQAGSWAGSRFMYSIDKTRSFDALAHLISIPSMTLFQESFLKSCEMMSQRHLEELLGPEDCPEERLRRLQIVGIECLSRVIAFPLNGIVDFWDLPIRRRLFIEHRLDGKQLHETFLHANSNRGLLSSTFLCEAVEVRELGHWAAFMLDGPCLVGNPQLVSLLAATFGAEQRLLDHHHLILPFFSKVLSDVMHIASIMVFAAGRMGLSVRGKYLFIAKTLHEALDEMRPYGANLMEDERPLFDLVFQLAYTLTESKPAFDRDQLADCLRAGRMQSIWELYPQICGILDGLGGMRHSSWAARLEIDTLIVLSQLDPTSANFPPLILWMMRRARANGIVLPVRCLLILLWSVRYGEGAAYADCRQSLINYILEHMTPHSDMAVFRQLDVAKFLPYGWKQTLARDREAWWSFPAGLPLASLVDVFASVHGLPVELPPGFPSMHMCSMGQLDELRLIIKGQIDYFLEHHFVPTGRKPMPFGDWPIYIPVVRSPFFLLSWFWVLLYLAHVLRILLPFHLHPLCFHMIQGSFSELSARLLVAESLQVEYEKYDAFENAAELQTRFLQRTLQFYKYIVIVRENPLEKGRQLDTVEGYMAFLAFLEHWAVGEAVPSLCKLEKWMHKDAGTIVEFMSPNVDLSEVFDDYLTHEEIMAILLSHPNSQ